MPNFAFGHYPKSKRSNQKLNKPTDYPIINYA